MNYQSWLGCHIQNAYNGLQEDAMSKITPLEKRRFIHKSAKFPSACPNFPYFFKIQKLLTFCCR
jgi:hypothetical protein